MLTVQAAQVLHALLAGDRYGLAITRRTGLKSGTVHPILVRLERAGWVTSELEQLGPTRPGRPPRRYYALTDTAQAERALTDLANQVTPP